MLALFWKSAYLIGLIALETSICCKVIKRKRTVLIRWLLFAVVMLCLSNTFMRNWEWTGNTIAENNVTNNEIWHMVIALISVGQIIVSYEVTVWGATYVAIIALFCHQNAFGLYKITEYYLLGTVKGIPDWYSVGIDLFYLICMCVTCHFFFGRKDTISVLCTINSKIVLPLSVGTLLSRNLLNMYLYANDENANLGNTMVVMQLFGMLFNSIAVYLIYSLLKQQILQIERVAMENIAKQRSSQYEFSHELMETISLKNHDLKKQIAFLKRAEVDMEEWLNELDTITEQFDNVIQTQNEALNTILSEKSMLCSQKDIPISINVDDTKMDFMKELDIYTLFANIMDNAIEASLKLEEGKRAISLNVYHQQGMLAVRCENYYSGEIRFKNNIPLTTKSDKLWHGFGTKSIEQTVKYYDGNMTFDSDNNIFKVKILIPIP